MNTKKSVKSKVTVIIGLLFLGSLALGVTKVLGQVVDLPRVSVVCELRNGQLVSVGDNFSKKDECKKSGRLVVLGEGLSGGGGSSGGGGYVGVGGVAFFSPTSGWLLKTDGTAWQSSLNGANGTYSWVPEPGRNLPTSVVINDVIVWDYSSFMLKNGDVYNYRTGDNSWVNTGHP